MELYQTYLGKSFTSSVAAEKYIQLKGDTYMSGKTKKTEHRIVTPFNDGPGGMVLEVVETVECFGCGETIHKQEYCTRKYNRSMGVQGYACVKCVPFRFAYNWSTRYKDASNSPVEFKGEW